MVDEAPAPRPQLVSGLRQVSVHRFGVGVDQRIEAEDEIDATVRHHSEGCTVVHDVLDVVIARESLATRGDAPIGYINQNQPVAVAA